MKESFLRIGLCDDDSNIIEILCSYIKQFAKSYKLQLKIYKFYSCQELLSNNIPCDILFLDIELKDGNGIKIGQELRRYNSKTKIIYLTSYSNFREIAFSVHAFDYLVKPITESQITSTLEEVMKFLPSVEQQPLRLIFHLKEGLHAFAINDLIYFEYINRKTVLHTTDNKSYAFTNESLKNILHIMRAHYFEMPHKSFVVNLEYIQSIKGDTIYLIDNIQIPLSQKYASNFRKIFANFIRGKVVL